ncbi:MAG TPA: DUF1015 family protein [Kineosporiaceae bacterium]
MVDLRPFPALRPAPAHAAQVAAPPYDVVDVAEARALTAGRPDSFLHVTRPEIDLPDGADPAAVHAGGRAALAALVTRGVLVPDAAPTLSVYRQRRGDTGPGQTGVVGLASVADYRTGTIAVHEHTRPEKEDDRVEHLASLRAHDEPVFLMYPGRPRIDQLVARVTDRSPDVRLADHEGVEHTLWVVADDTVVTEFVAAFEALDRLYVADGHHRSAAAARLHDRLPGVPGTEGFPVVAFPAEQLTVLPYHRLVAGPVPDLPDLLTALAEQFDVVPGPFESPLERHHFGLYAGGGRWYRLTAREGTVDELDPIGRLDVALLQRAVLGPRLQVTDPRTDPRLAFVGGSRPVAEVERAVDFGRHALAFALHPTSTAEVMAVADRGLVMPPKSTWFDPKLASGLFVHPLG